MRIDQSGTNKVPLIQLHKLQRRIIQRQPMSPRRLLHERTVDLPFNPRDRPFCDVHERIYEVLEFGEGDGVDERAVVECVAGHGRSSAGTWNGDEEGQVVGLYGRLGMSTCLHFRTSRI